MEIYLEIKVASTDWAVAVVVIVRAGVVVKAIHMVEIKMKYVVYTELLIAPVQYICQILVAMTTIAMIARHSNRPYAGSRRRKRDVIRFSCSPNIILYMRTTSMGIAGRSTCPA